jgi:outer membrane murein-binding lipoprotein Lpp
MSGTVVQWARRWLGIEQLVAENRRLTAEVRSLRIELEQVRANIVAAQKAAHRAQASGDGFGRVVAVLRRGL